ncbi:4-coumarate-CoA ligase [Phaeosphaeria sp. MPI-PUGE-AT-0046c]|nr:4-coumarate-CoA ligase [Phaeosphaeria sp. MPI-PUGE-AT-0046c]
MPFLAKEHIPIPTKDILSWMYDDPVYDQDTPVFIDAHDPSVSISAAHAKTLIRQLVAGFRKAGVEEGDTVLLHSFNNLYYPVIVLGIIGCGANFCGTNPSYTTGELNHTIRTSQARIIICDPDVLGDSVTNAAKQCGIPASNLFVLDSGPTTPKPSTFKGFASWRALLTHGEQDWLRFDSEEKSRNTTAFLCFSSGTTGLPKAAQLSHYNLIAEHVLVFQHRPHPYPRRRLIALPMFHAATAPSTHISALKAGHVNVIMRRYDPSIFMHLIPKFAITDLVLVPPQVTSLLALPLSVTEKKAHLSSVRCVWGGGAPLDAVTQNAFSAFLPSSTPFTQIWAMTETSCFASLTPYPEKDNTGSMGIFLPNIDVKILDDAGTDISAFDVRGELAIRGPTVTRGYLGRARDADFDHEGYFRTGDVLYCNKETGKWYIVDRKKELIKVRGFQVAPAEVEGVLLECPGVADVAVLGVKNKGGDSEMVRAYVVRKEGWSEGAINAGNDEEKTISQEDVKRWVEGRLAKYKWLEGGVRFLDSLPKTASGKILKRVLREGEAREGAKL